MRVISWNMNRRKSPKSWKFLDSLNPDIAMLQEASSTEGTNKVNLVHEINIKKRNSNLIYVPEKSFKSVSTLAESGVRSPNKLNNDTGKKIKRGTKMGINVCQIDDTKLGAVFFVSVYGNLDFSPRLTINLHYVINRYIFELRKKYKAINIIIAGDFNMDRRMDNSEESHSFSHSGKTVNFFFDNILELGFYDCLRSKYPNYIQTHRHSLSSFPWQIDHMFCTKELYDELEDINIINNNETKELSDHYPIVADFSI
jgi:exonuclease III